ncbi:MAG: trigger factor, partial [Bacilli bacterium]|nr:trigger factor [Bacilli bacterium]
MAKKENKNVHELIQKIDGDTWKSAIDKVFLEKQKTVKVDGFRQGKVPRNIYEQKFGKESLFLDAANHVLNDAYVKMMEESKLIPVVQPSVDIKSISEDGVEFVFKVITKPEVKVKKYKGLKIKPEKVKVTDEEINHELGHLLERYTELVTKEKGKVENGDVAIIDFEGFKDGVAFDGGKGENYSLEIGSHSFIPGFEEGVIGMKALEEKDLKLKFPEDYGAKDLAGKEVVFNVTVHDIKKRVVPELDEEFFKDLDMEGVTNKEELDKVVEKELQAQKEEMADNKYTEDLLEAASKNMKVEIDEEIIDDETEYMYKDFVKKLEMQGVSEDLYYAYARTTKEDVKKEMKKEAEIRLKYRYLLEAIIKEEKISVTDKEAKEEVKKIANESNMTEEHVMEHLGGNLDR